jgi:hypothetical protein
VNESFGTTILNVVSISDSSSLLEECLTPQLTQTQVIDRSIQTSSKANQCTLYIYPSPLSSAESEPPAGPGTVSTPHTPPFCPLLYSSLPHPQPRTRFIVALAISIPLPQNPPSSSRFRHHNLLIRPLRIRRRFQRTSHFTRRRLRRDLARDRTTTTLRHSGLRRSPSAFRLRYHGRRGCRGHV